MESKPNGLTVEFLEARITQWQLRLASAEREANYAANQLLQHRNLLAVELGQTVMRDFRVVEGDDELF